MRILHITAMEILSPNSGIPAVLKNLSEAQNNIAGIEAIVLSLKAEVNDIPSKYFYYLNKEDIGEYIKRINPDLAILHGFFHPVYFYVVRALMRNGVPFCNEPHSSFGRKALKKSALKKFIANNTIFRPQINKAKAYIFTNQQEYDDSKYHTTRDVVIPNGVIPSIVSSAKPKTQESIKKPIFYYLGRYDVHHKGLDYLFDALDILDKKKCNIMVKFFGIGDEKQILYVRNRLANLNIIDAKDYGAIYGDEKKKELELCNILLLTSRYEGSPMTVLDGFSYGNPCIVTPGTNVADEASNNQIGWKTELDAENIATTIIKAAEEYKKDWLGYYNRCRQHVIDNYLWDKIASLSIAKYKEILINNENNEE